MKIEVSNRCLVNVDPAPGVMITPPIDEDFWIIRVPLSEKQAIVTFPKFGCFAVAFQKEEDWNTNLPHTCDAGEIYEHIKHNKGDDSIKDEDCLEAIRIIQDHLNRMLAEVRA